MYKIINETAIRRLRDGAYIPMADGNTEYATYLEWLEEGNTPEPADEVVAVNPVTTTARAYRDTELKRADIQLLKVQDGANGLGTQKAWREYRVLLRDWPSTESFPLEAPVAPDAGIK